MSVLRALERLAPFTASAAALPVFSVILAGTILVSVLADTVAGPVGASEADTQGAPALDSPVEPDTANDTWSPGRVVPNGIDFLRRLVGASAQQEPFLALDEAFRLSVAAKGPDRLVATWQIAPEYYLYRDRIQVEIADGESTSTLVEAVELPPGTLRDDPYFGPVEIYRTEAHADIVLAHAGELVPEAVELALTYQGCADAGLCYPPERKVLPMVLPDSAIPSGDGTAPDPSAELSDADRIARTLSSERLLIGLVAFFGFGLLLSLTPCVLPMIPILSSVLAACGGTISAARGFALSLSYVLASALAYAAIGSVAGLLGANLQIVLQSPPALLATSAVFVALALSMLGLYSIQVPGAWQSWLDGWARSVGRSGGHAGAAAMGLVSALIVGPCVAAPLAGAVIYIGQVGDPIRGALALFTLGLGMGAPLLLFGASAGRMVPRAGRWMAAVRPAIGVVMLGVAVYLLERVVPPAAALAGWAAVASVAALLIARAASRMPRREWRLAGGGAATLTTLYAAVLLTGAATGASSPLRPMGGLASVSDVPLEFVAVKGIRGPAGLEAALARAEAQGRFVVLDFYADWCVSCKEMEDTTFRDTRVRSALEGSIALRADVTAYDDADRALMRQLGVLGPPAILFFSPDRAERRRYRLVGFEDADEFAQRLTGAFGAA